MALARVDIVDIHNSDRDSRLGDKLEVRLFGSAAVRMHRVRIEDAPGWAVPPRSYAASVFERAEQSSKTFGGTEAEFVDRCRRELKLNPVLLLASTHSYLLLLTSTCSIRCFYLLLLTSTYSCLLNPVLLLTSTYFYLLLLT